MAKITINPITGSYASVTAINNRFAQLETALNDSVLWRGGFIGEPNAMSVDVDMDGNTILNLDVLNSTVSGGSIADGVSWAQEWAIAIEGLLISAGAGGNGTSDYSALHWAAKSAADVIVTNADVVSTGLDVIATGLDVVSTNGDVVSTGLDVGITNADVVSTNADVVSTNSDVITTNADVLTTNGDVISTNADVLITNGDVLVTNADAITTSGDVIITNADVVVTNADVVLTNADVISTNADVVLTNADVNSTTADVLLTAADVVLTGADVLTTNGDVLTTNADVGITNADVVSTNADVILTNADVVSTNSDLLLTNADVSLTGTDVLTTNADVVTTNGDVVLTGADLVATNLKYDEFDDRYLGAKAAAPSTLNDGITTLGAAHEGIEYWNSTTKDRWTWDGASWGLTSSSVATSANLVSIADAGGYYTGTDVEVALQELKPKSAELLSLTVSDGASNLFTISTFVDKPWYTQIGEMLLLNIRFKITGVPGAPSGDFNINPGIVTGPSNSNRVYLGSAYFKAGITITAGKTTHGAYRENSTTLIKLTEQTPGSADRTFIQASQVAVNAIIEATIVMR